MPTSTEDVSLLYFITESSVWFAAGIFLTLLGRSVRNYVD